MLPRVLDPVWSLAVTLYLRQCAAWRVAERWDDIGTENRLDWFEIADRRLHPENYGGCAGSDLYRRVMESLRAA